MCMELRYGVNEYGPKRPQATKTASTSSTASIATMGASLRRACTAAAPAITSANPTAASGISIGAICIAAGRISPMAPNISASPINRILVGLKSWAQPWPDVTSLSFGHKLFHQSASDEDSC